MLLAIESLVRLFEGLLMTKSTLHAQPGQADNDNDEMFDDERRWAAYR